MIRKIILLTALLIPLILCAQNLHIRGKAIDENGIGLAYTTVRLLRSDSVFVNGTATDSLGRYQLSVHSSTDYLLSFSNIGYHSQVVSVKVTGEDLQIADVVLKTGNVELGEVVVKGQSFIRQTDKVLIIPDKQQLRHANTGYDLLYNLMIPGVDIDRRAGTAKTFGGNVTLYIDGRKVEYREVQNLRARDIEQVEYFDVPTGQYAGDVASINYITRSYKTGGYISLDADQTIGYLKGNYNGAAKLMQGNTSYNFYVGHQMQRHDGIKTNSLEIFRFDDYEVTRHYETMDDVVKSNSQYAQFRVLNQNKKHILSGSFSFARNAAPDNRGTGKMVYGVPYNLDQQSASYSNQKSLLPSVDLYGKFLFQKGRVLEASLSSGYTTTDYSRTYAENDFDSYTEADEQFYNLSANLKFLLPLKHRNSLTTSFIHSHKISSVTYAGDYIYWQHLWTGETLLFVEYAHNLSKRLALMITPGLSSLQYHLHGDKHVSHFSPRVRLRLRYLPAKQQQLMLQCSVDNSFPGINTINRADQTMDFLRIRRGNPEMDNTNLYAAALLYSLQAGRFNITAVTEGRYTNNAIVDHYYTEGDKMICSFLDGASAYNLSGILSVAWKASDNLRLKWDTFVKREILTGTASAVGNALRSSLQVDFYWKNFGASLRGATPYRSQVHQYSEMRAKHYATYNFSVSWTQRNWRIEGGTNCPFSRHNTEYFIWNTDAYSLRGEQSGRILQQTGYVKVAYTFDFGRKTSRENKTIDTSVNSAILK